MSDKTITLKEKINPCGYCDNDLMSKDVFEHIKKLKKKNSDRGMFAFDEIQRILDEKEKGDFDINLDIKMKLWTQVHSISIDNNKYIDEIIGEFK